MTGRPRRAAHIGELGTGRRPDAFAGTGHPDRAVGGGSRRGRVGQEPAVRGREQQRARAVGVLGRRP
ncbi:hypothetical protein, partial [Streptomyces sp. NPDC096153]|uniref:hypothetical protein n=1 Tax=Streptomyces sp. NPDC096153 TaxID=3155548 RepID=UPI003321F0E4